MNYINNTEDLSSVIIKIPLPESLETNNRISVYGKSLYQLKKNPNKILTKIKIFVCTNFFIYFLRKIKKPLPIDKGSERNK